MGDLFVFNSRCKSAQACEFIIYTIYFFLIVDYVIVVVRIFVENVFIIQRASNKCMSSPFLQAKTHPILCFGI